MDGLIIVQYDQFVGRSRDLLVQNSCKIVSDVTVEGAVFVTHPGSEIVPERKSAALAIHFGA